jgi:ribonuclease HII
VPHGLICPARPIIGGDALSLSIAAASIIAKTTRDAPDAQSQARLSPIWLR